MAKTSTYQCLLLFFVLTWTLASSAIYKSVMWTTNNPLFQNHNKSDNNLKSFCYGGELEMRVYLKSVLPLVCPFEDLIMQNMDSQPSSGVLYENLWIVYDEESYRDCKINLNVTSGNGSFKLKNKLLYKCDTPDTYKKLFYRIDFKEDSPVPGVVYFEANTTYYFLATSDGTQGSLDQTSGGHCNNDGDKEIRMKFKVYVCGTNEFFTDPKCTNPNDIGVFKCMKTQTTSPPRSSPPTSSPPTSSPLSTISPSPTISSAPSISSNKNQSSGFVAGKRTSEDVELRKSKENWMIVAVMFMLCFIVGLIVMVIICYRLKKKYSVPCIYSSQISTSKSPEISPTNTMDKTGLVKSYHNLAIDGVDGPKKIKDIESVVAVEMKTQSPPHANGVHGKSHQPKISLTSPANPPDTAHADHGYFSNAAPVNRETDQNDSIINAQRKNGDTDSGNGSMEKQDRKTDPRDKHTANIRPFSKLPPINVGGKHGWKNVNGNTQHNNIEFQV